MPQHIGHGSERLPSTSSGKCPRPGSTPRSALSVSVRRQSPGYVPAGMTRCTSTCGGIYGRAPKGRTATTAGRPPGRPRPLRQDQPHPRRPRRRPREPRMGETRPRTRQQGRGDRAGPARPGDGPGRAVRARWLLRGDLAIDPFPLGSVHTTARNVHTIARMASKPGFQVARQGRCRRAAQFREDAEPSGAGEEQRNGGAACICGRYWVAIRSVARWLPWSSRGPPVRAALR